MVRTLSSQSLGHEILKSGVLKSSSEMNPNTKMSRKRMHFRNTVKDKRGLNKSNLLAKILLVDSDFVVLQPLSTNCNKASMFN